MSKAEMGRATASGASERAPREQWFFDSVLKRARLWTELAEWRGTKFCEHQCVKGVAADCVRFAVAVLVNVGATRDPVWPDYICAAGGKPMGDRLHAGLLSLHNGVLIYNRHAPCVSFLEFPLMPGDLLECSENDRGHHLAIFAGDKTIWHCRYRAGVTQQSGSDPATMRGLRAIVRFKV